MPPFPVSFFERLVRSAPDALIVLHAARIVFVNERAEEMFGYPQQELLDRGLEPLLSARSRDFGAALGAEPAQSDTVTEREILALRKDGSEFPAEAAVRQMKIDDQELIAVAIRDISRRQYEQQLHRAEQMMAVGQVAAGVAHELRNPLTSIKGLVQVNLREARARGLPAQDLAVIEHEIRRMERTVRTFLDFARPPKPARRRLEPASLVQRVFALVAGRAKKLGVSLQLLRPDAPVWLEADQDQLQQLLLNLILNALDAMPQGGRVEVELRPPSEGFVEIQVRDTGPGIPAHILPKVFETFVSSKETGIGLGVPVSQRIAEDHGGSLSAYNLPAGGACFLLRLPAPSST